MHIQDLLTYLAESVLIGSIALYSSLFITGFMARHRRAVCPGQLEIDFAAVQPEQQAPAPEPARSLNHVILPFVRPVRQEQPEQHQASVLDDTALIAWAKANKAQLPEMAKAIGKWSRSRKLRASEKAAILAAMPAA